MLSPQESHRIYVWDVPTRLVHWLLVVLVAFSWWSAKNDQMEYHRYSGYMLLGVLMFRLYWGIFGSATARFAEFVQGPRAVLNYIKKMVVRASDRPQSTTVSAVGHNPLGALSVVMLLGILLLQVGLGLFAVDVDGIESGPLSSWVSFAAGRACAKVHAIVFNALMALVMLHIIAILFYLVVKRDNLVSPMITGAKPLLQNVERVTVAAPLIRVVVGLVFAAAVVWVIV